MATDDRPVASGLRVVGRVALPGPAAAVAVGEGAVRVLLEQGTLLRVNPDRRTFDRLSLALDRAGNPGAAAEVCETELARFLHEARRYKLVQQIEKRAQRRRAKARLASDKARLASDW